MKLQFDTNPRTDKNRQCITGGIFYCRDSAGFSFSTSNELLCNWIVNLPQTATFHTATVTAQSSKQKQQTEIEK